jgi:predicted regulator of Ras-like GTPase activity (Roadblock/LC7/MglB family)
MNNVLKGINRIKGVRGSLLINREGMIMVSEVTEGVDETGISALASSIYVNIENALQRLDFGKLTKFSISGDRGRIVFFNVMQELVLTVLTRKDINMGLLKVELDKAGEELTNMLNR